VDKDVLPAVIRHDEAKAALGIPFLQFAAVPWLIHSSLPFHWRRGAVLFDFVGSILGVFSMQKLATVLIASCTNSTGARGQFRS
jgi:hypothetical protein